MMRILVVLLAVLLLHTTSAWAQFGEKKMLLDYTFKPSPSTMAVADLNKDGRQDLVVSINLLTASNSNTAPASYFIQNANGTLTEYPLSGSVSHGNIGFIETIDLDGNGYKDIIALTSNVYTNATNKILVWYNDGGSIQSYPQVLLQNLGISGGDVRLHLSDIDLDGRTDVVLSNLHSSDKVVWLKNTGRYSTWPLTVLQNIMTTGDILVADLNGDGRVEIIADGYIYSGAGFTTKTAVEMGDGYMVATDIDRDGDLDIVGGTYNTDEHLSWFENKGNFSFTRHDIPVSGGGFSAIHITDFDQDGLPDIAAGCRTSCRLTLFHNKGNGEFTVSYLSQTTPGLQTHESLRSADMDQDGKLDLLLSDYAWRSVSWFKNGFPEFEGVRAGFKAAVTPCSLAPVQFSDMSLGKNIVSWAWDFGDGATAVTQHPTHTYQNTGTYQVTLRVTKADGATNSTSKSVQITGGPEIEEQYEFWFCEGENDFTFTVEAPEEGVTYRWSDYYGYAYLLTGSTITVNAQEATLYLEKVAQNGCASKRVPVYIKANPQPKAPVVQDAVSYKGPSVLRLEAVDPDGGKNLVYNWYDVNYTYGGIPVHTGAVYERQFSKTQELYVEAISPSGCRSATRTRVTAYIHAKPLTIPEFKWAVTGESLKSSDGFDITCDTQGNMLTLGQFSGFDAISSGGKAIQPGDSLTTEWRNWSYRINHYLFKYGSDGKAIDALRIINQVSQTDGISINGIDTDADNNIILTGYMNGQAFLPKGKTPSLLGYVIIKLNQDGELLWVKRIRVEGSFVLAQNVKTRVEKDGSFTCEVTFQGRGDLEGQLIGKTIYLNNYLWNRYVLRYDKDGGLISMREIAAMDYYYNPTYPYNNNQYYIGNSDVVVDEEENIYQLGDFTGLTFFASERIQTSFRDKPSVLLAKYSAQGQMMWYKLIALNHLGSNSRKIIYHDNALYVTGISTVMNNENTNFSGKYINNASAFISKYDLDGNLLWVKPIECKGDASITVNDILIDNAGNPYIIGVATGPVSFDGLLIKNEQAVERRFSYIAMYEKDGALGWAKSISNTNEEHGSPYSLKGAFDKTNQLTIHGTYFNSLKLDGLEMNSPNQRSMFTAKLGYTLKAAMQVDGNCVGEPVTFQDLTNNTPSEIVIERTWDFGDGATSTAVSPTHSYGKEGTYLVKLTTHGSLGSVSTVQHTLQITKAPVAVITAKDLQLTASAGESYRWFLNDSLLAETSRTIVANKSGKYKVEVSANGCSGISDAVDVQLPVLQEENEEKEITGFPNPASDFLQIMSREHRITGYVIYDMKGNAIMSSKFPGEFNITLDLRAYPAGIYFVHVELANGDVPRYKCLKQ